MNIQTKKIGGGGGRVVGGGGGVGSGWGVRVDVNGEEAFVKIQFFFFGGEGSGQGGGSGGGVRVDGNRELKLL